MEANYRNVELSNTDKVFFSEDDITKKDMIKYYDRISSVMIPHMKGRPLTLHRFPDGIDNEGFYQKEIPGYFPRWIDRATIEKREGGEITYVVVNDKETLIYLANQACITPHIWLSKVAEPKKPDKLVFDLDPSSKDFKLIVKAARKLKRVLEGADLDVYVMTTGSRGLHVVVPIIPEMQFDDVRNYAGKIAEAVAKESPEDFTVQHRKDKRKGRVFIDYSRNAFGQTSVAPYGIRGIAGAPVAAPLDWDELADKGFHPRKYNMKNMFRRLGQKQDPWRNMHVKASSFMKVKSLL